NIMLVRRNDGERAVLMDFGLAHEWVTTTSDRIGGVAGTPEYMAPEQFEGKPSSPATDIYALGVIVYELLTGIHPYAASNPMAVAVRRASHPDPVTCIAAKTPRRWDRIISKCLVYEPKLRFQTSSEVARALLSSSLRIENLRKDRPRL